jgi:hypothetical protein
MHVGPYQRDIIKQLGCSAEDAAMVEDIMRTQVFHSTLDWLSAAELQRGARKAWAILEADRELFEGCYRDVQRIFAERKQQEE